MTDSEKITWLNGFMACLNGSLPTREQWTMLEVMLTSPSRTTTKQGITLGSPLVVQQNVPNIITGPPWIVTSTSARDTDMNVSPIDPKGCGAV